ncbi:MAG: glycosyltransferase [Flavobacteriales bacterium]|nr:glycosyltransferase [Flavobacteriales bacterium]
MTELSYSIVIPVYNGAPFLKEIVERTIAISKDKFQLKQIILVDDASSDNSWQIIQELKAEHPVLITGLLMEKNFGQHNVTCAGIQHCSGSYIITMDDDLETAPEDIINLINAQKESNANVVYGKFQKTKRNLLRKLLKFPYEVVAKIVGDGSKVNGSSFRLIETTLAKKIATSATNFVFIDEVIAWYTTSIAFVTVSHYPSRRKSSHYSLGNLLRLGGEVVVYSSLLPLKAVKVVGFLVSFTMFLIGIYFLVKQLFFDIPVQGFAALIVTITFSTGIIMFTLGVIGEYLGKIFRNSNNSPVYSIRKEI